MSPSSDYGPGARDRSAVGAIDPRLKPSRGPGPRPSPAPLSSRGPPVSVPSLRTAAGGLVACVAVLAASVLSGSASMRGPGRRGMRVGRHPPRRSGHRLRLGHRRRERADAHRPDDLPALHAGGDRRGPAERRRRQSVELGEQWSVCAASIAIRPPAAASIPRTATSTGATGTVARAGGRTRGSGRRAIDSRPAAWRGGGSCRARTARTKASRGTRRRDRASRRRRRRPRPPRR